MLDNETPEPQEGTPEESGDKPIQLTQAELNRMMAERSNRAKESANKANSERWKEVLETLGVGTEDELKTTIADYKKKREAEMTETQKLQAQLAQRDKELADAQHKADELLQQSIRKERDGIVLEALQKAGAQYPQDALVVAFNVLGVTFDVFGEDGKADEKELQRKVMEIKQARPELFRPAAQGTLSPNQGGKPVSPQKVNIQEIVKQKIKP